MNHLNCNIYTTAETGLDSFLKRKLLKKIHPLIHRVVASYVYFKEVGFKEPGFCDKYTFLLL